LKDKARREAKKASQFQIDEASRQLSRDEAQAELAESAKELEKEATPNTRTVPNHTQEETSSNDRKGRPK
jgi:hypothetical protein